MDKKVILNFVLFQVAWFSCVLGAANQIPWLGLLVVLAIVAGQLFFAPQPSKELLLLISAAIIGAVVDQGFLMGSIVQYQSHGWSSTIVPVWIVALWIGFSSTLNVSLRWLRGRHVIAFLFGAIGGPMAYIAAEKLGAVTITPQASSYIVLGLAWACVTLLLLALSKRFDGYAHA